MNSLKSTPSPITPKLATTAVSAPSPLRDPSTTVPPSDGSNGFKKQTRFKQNEYRDLWAFIFFYINLAIYYGIIGYLIYLQVVNDKDETNTSGIFNQFRNTKLLISFFTSCGISIIVSLAITLLSILCIFYNPIAFVKGSFFAMIVWIAFVSVLSLFSAFPIGAIIGLLSCVLLGIFYFFIRKRIPFSATILKSVVDIFRVYPASIWLSGVTTIVQGVNVALLLFAIPGLKIALNKQIIPNGLISAIGIYLFFDACWQIGTMINIVQTTVAGLIATIFLASGQIINPTIMAFKRASTISFGSIALGSLLVSIVQTIRFILSAMSDDRNSIFAAIADCFLGLIENLMRYFNYYAYTYIAIYGNSYFESAKQVYQLIKGKGIDSIVNDNIISTVFTLISLVIGLTCGLISLFVYRYWLIKDNSDPTLVIFLSIIVGLVGTFIPMIVCGVFGSAATAIFVCYAEEPQAVQSNKPELFQELRIRDVGYV